MSQQQPNIFLFFLNFFSDIFILKICLMPNFFLPNIEDVVLIERTYNHIILSNENSTGHKVFSKKIYKLESLENGKSIVYQVGNNCEVINKQIYAILETELTYLICCPTRGAVNGVPLLVSKKDVYKETLFDD